MNSRKSDRLTVGGDGGRRSGAQIIKDLPPIPHAAAGSDCSGFIVAEEFQTTAETKSTLKCDTCGLVVGTINGCPSSLYRFIQLDVAV